MSHTGFLDLPPELILLTASNLKRTERLALALSSISLYRLLKPGFVDLKHTFFDTPGKRDLLPRLFALNMVPRMRQNRAHEVPRLQAIRARMSGSNTQLPVYCWSNRTPTFDEWLAMALCTRCWRIRDGGDPYLDQRHEYFGTRFLCWSCKRRRREELHRLLWPLVPARHRSMLNDEVWCGNEADLEAMLTTAPWREL